MEISRNTVKERGDAIPWVGGNWLHDVSIAADWSLSLASQAWLSQLMEFQLVVSISFRELFSPEVVFREFLTRALKYFLTRALNYYFRDDEAVIFKAHRRTIIYCEISIRRLSWSRESVKIAKTRRSSLGPTTATTIKLSQFVTSVCALRMSAF